MTTPDPLVGRQLGEYQILKCLGQGGMGTVYLANEPRLNRRVAVKTMIPELARNPQVAERFLNEAQVLANLQHPNIVPIYSLNYDPPYLYIVMAHIAGGSLAQRMGRPILYRWVMLVGRAIATALDYAQQRGIIHRDIKPANILLTDQHHPLLSDFGIARFLGGPGLGTHLGVPIGTWAYMAPEQKAGSPYVDARADIYALGLVLYEMLAGDLNAVLDVSTGLPQQPSKVLVGLAQPVEQILCSALAPDPRNRFGSAAKMAQAIATVEQWLFTSGELDRTLVRKPPVFRGFQ